MNDREKKLLVLVGIIVFLILNLAAWSLVYSPRKKVAEAKEKEYVDKIAVAQVQEVELVEIQPQVEWLERNEQKLIKSWQKALADLESLANREAQRRGLTVKQVKPMNAADFEGLDLHRARVEIEVSGREQVLFQWLDRLNSPSDLRAVTSLIISPKKDDDTQVDCQVRLEQWFVPETIDPIETTT